MSARGPAASSPNVLDAGGATARSACLTSALGKCWLYLAVVMDFFSRLIVGSAVGPTIHRELVLNAVLMAVGRRRPRGTQAVRQDGNRKGDCHRPALIREAAAVRKALDACDCPPLQRLLES